MKSLEKIKFSLFAKVNFISYVLVSIVGVFSVWLVEDINIDATVSDSQNVIYIASAIRDASNDWNAHREKPRADFNPRSSGHNYTILAVLYYSTILIMLT